MPTLLSSPLSPGDNQCSLTKDCTVVTLCQLVIAAVIMLRLIACNDNPPKQITCNPPGFPRLVWRLTELLFRGHEKLAPSPGVLTWYEGSLF